MPGASRKIDKAGSDMAEASGDVFINGEGAVVTGMKVKPHGSGTHGSAKMTGGSGTVFVNGKALIRAGDKATCGHAITGSSNVNAG